MTTRPLVSEYAHVPDDPDQVGQRWFTGAALLIVADASFVAALSFAYLYLRAVNTEGAFHPAKSASASLWWSWVVTACMAAGFLAYRHGLSAVEPSRLSRFVRSGLVGLALMTVALVLNVVQLVTFPFAIDDNAYASAVFVLAAGNVFHLLVTLFTGIGAVNRVRRGLVEAPQLWSLRAVGLWWAWVCVASFVGALTISVANGTLG
jgi:heme/copper-type cytochrome/quinol oxidase subunit 3